MRIELKFVRHVRTPRGQTRFHDPIGGVIVPDYPAHAGDSVTLNTGVVRRFTAASYIEYQPYTGGAPESVREIIQRRGLRGLLSDAHDDLERVVATIVGFALGAHTGLKALSVEDARLLVIGVLQQLAAAGDTLSDGDYNAVVNKVAMAMHAEEKRRILHVDTPEGARKYGQPIGAIIDLDVVKPVERHRRVRPPKGYGPGTPVVDMGQALHNLVNNRAHDGSPLHSNPSMAQTAARTRRAAKPGAPPKPGVPAERHLTAVPDAPETAPKKPKLVLPGDDPDVPMKAGSKYGEGDPRNDPTYAAYVDSVDEKLGQAMDRGEATNQRFSVVGPDGKMRYTDERLALHDQIVDAIIAKADRNGVPRTKRAIMMGGLPGSGKSTFLKDHGAKLGLTVDAKGDPTNAIVINPDVIKDILLQLNLPNGDPAVPRTPGLKDGEHASLMHEESGDISRKLSQRALAGGYDVVFDITLGNAGKARNKYLSTPEGAGARDLGYTVAAAFVDGDLALSLHRAGLRHKQPDKDTGHRLLNGRYVPMEHIIAEGPHVGDVASDGSPARSHARVEYDSMIKAGDFDYAIRMDNKSGEFFTDHTSTMASRYNKDGEGEK